NKNYGYGKLLELISPSPRRVESVCGVFGRCGGCTLLTADYDFQKELKRRAVADVMERIGGFKDVVVGDCVGSDPCFGYRNKAQYPAVRTEKGVELGFYAPRSHRVVPCGDCALQNPRIREIAAEISAWATEEKISVYDEESGRGCLRHVYVRTGASEALAVIVAAFKPKNSGSLVERLRNKFPDIVGVVLNINSKKTNTILGDRQEIIWGRDYIVDNIGQIKYKIHYKSFYQVNPHTTRLLYDHVLSRCALTGTETVYDLYCGGGTIGLYLARNAKKVVGIEIVPEAVENAVENAELNGIENAEFYCGKAEELCPEIAESGARADVVVLDPPRKGCERALLEAAVKMEPRRIVYVSCNPSTAARDCALLRELGYELTEVTPFDQFPHTAHVECVALLSRKSQTTYQRKS
ncbi:MAG: 23S rRNA (uracil(1939)-C(5))-methyltransferase RlmD, partial [Clostridia bacterium]